MTEVGVLPPEADTGGGDKSGDTLSDHDFPISLAQFPRRIIAEDPTYNRPEIPHLKTLCLNTIVLIYDGTQNLKRLSPYEKHYIIKRLPVNFPLLEAIRFISEEIYWQKRCLSQWDLCNPADYGGSWKVMCLQRTIEEMIEDYVPDGKDLAFKQLKPIIVAANKYIRKLDIKKLKAVASHGSHKSEDDPRESEEYRINFEQIFTNLPHLEEIHITYSMDECGENFDWYMTRLTYDDVKIFQVSLLPCYNLRVLHLYRSDLDCIKVNLLMPGLLHLPALEILQLSNNKIGDKGAHCLAKLLITTPKLHTLDLHNNRIAESGAEALAFALTKNVTLKVLNLRLNYLNRKGCDAICRILAVNKTLTKINLAANDMMEENAEILSKALKFNDSITTIDLSCNPLIDLVGGVHILEGLENNKTVKEFDIRWCNCGQETEHYLDQLLQKNRSLSSDKM